MVKVMTFVLHAPRSAPLVCASSQQQQRQQKKLGAWDKACNRVDTLTRACTPCSLFFNPKLSLTAPETTPRFCIISEPNQSISDTNQAHKSTPLLQTPAHPAPPALPPTVAAGQAGTFQAAAAGAGRLGLAEDSQPSGPPMATGLQQLQEQGRALWGAVTQRNILLPTIFVFLWQVCAPRVARCSGGDVKGSIWCFTREGRRTPRHGHCGELAPVSLQCCIQACQAWLGIDWGN
jgi:hypothetical protein